MQEHPDSMVTVKPDATSADVEMSIPELFLFALHLHRSAGLDGAEKCYRAILKVEPDNANALHYLGVLLQQKGKPVEPLELIRKSIAIDPMVASWHNNLGNVLLQQGMYEEAAAAYARCAELDPDNMEILNNLGALLRNLSRPKEAEEMLLRALSRNPGLSDAHANLASLYTSLGRMPESFSHFADALALKPNDMNTRRLMAIAYGCAGRLGDGLKACQEWLELEPDNAQAKHLLAAFGGSVVPDRASEQYVEDEFDGFATSFDAKLASLNYRAPELVGEAVARLCAAADRRWQILDVGCGTGLCGPLLKPFASQLVGVDLSTNMLEQAQQRGIYDELIKGELVAFLNACAGEQDLVVSADTLCYFGRLEVVFSAVCRTLRAGGHWVFTVESHEDAADFRLQYHGRYSHSRHYIESALGQARFSKIILREVVLRQEGGLPVAGWLVSAQAHEA